MCCRTHFPDFGRLFFMYLQLIKNQYCLENIEMTQVTQAQKFVPC